LSHRVPGVPCVTAAGAERASCLVDRARASYSLQLSYAWKNGRRGAMRQRRDLPTLVLAFALGCGGRSGLDVLGAAPQASGNDATVGTPPVKDGSSSSGVTSHSGSGSTSDGGGSGSGTGSSSGANRSGSGAAADASPDADASLDMCDLTDGLIAHYPWCTAPHCTREFVPGRGGDVEVRAGGSRGVEGGRGPSRARSRGGTANATGRAARTWPRFARAVGPTLAPPRHRARIPVPVPGCV